jgi:hypothetical protein
MTKILHISSGTLLKFCRVELIDMLTGSIYHPPQSVSSKTNGMTEVYEQSYYWIKYKYSLDEFILFLADGFYLSVFNYNNIPIDIKPMVTEFEIIP